MVLTRDRVTPPPGLHVSLATTPITVTALPSLSNSESDDKGMSEIDGCCARIFLKSRVYDIKLNTHTSFAALDPSSLPPHRRPCNHVSRPGCSNGALCRLGRRQGALSEEASSSTGIPPIQWSPDCSISPNMREIEALKMHIHQGYHHEAAAQICCLPHPLRARFGRKLKRSLEICSGCTRRAWIQQRPW